MNRLKRHNRKQKIKTGFELNNSLSHFKSEEIAQNEQITIQNIKLA